MKKKLFLIGICLLICPVLKAQVGINTITPEGALDVVSANSGVIVPRVATTNAVTTPVNGMIIYDLSSNCFKCFQEGVWSGCGFVVLPDPSTNGTGVVTTYVCSTASAGTLTAGTPVSGVTQTITATVTKLGTYSISTTANGVTFAGAGTFAGTGAQNIVLTATGTPTAAGTNAFTLNTTPGCSFNRTAVAAVPTVTSATGRIWMDRNLGATQVATSSADAASYGDLYQWGRATDGHQLRTSTTVTGTSSSTTVTGTNASKFLIQNNGSYNWYTGTNPDNLWQGVAGINNPCPSGFRLPTKAEWDAEIATWSPKTSVGAFASPLKLPMAGEHYYTGTTVTLEGTYGQYYSSTVNGNNAYYILFSAASNSAGSQNLPRSSGYSVRCIKD